MADLWVNPLHLRHEVANIPYVAAGAEGDAFDNEGHDRILFVDNRSNEKRTVAEGETRYCSLHFEHPRYEVEIPPGQQQIIGPFTNRGISLSYPLGADGLYVVFVGFERRSVATRPLPS